MEPSQPEAILTSNRKSVKKGIDSDVSRKNREEKGIQLRKDKRQDRANVERRKFKVDDNDDQKTEIPSHTRTRNLEILPKKCELLMSEDVAKQRDAAVYFRRVLAADKFPPLDLVIEMKMVIPTLISFLSRFGEPELQIEAAWSLTNIACGEARHISCLVDHGAIPLLVNVVDVTKNIALRDQAMWALSNMSSDEYACQALSFYPNILVPLLKQVGINCPMYRQFPPGMSVFKSASNVQTIAAFDMPEFPSLSTMRYVAFVCGNFARLSSVRLSAPEYQYIIYALADLIQSPDEDIIKDICNSLIVLCHERPETLQWILEQGFLSKMKEFFELSVLCEIALLVVCAVVRASASSYIVDSGRSNLIRATAMAHNSRAKPTLQHLVDLLGKTDSAVARKDVCCALSILCNGNTKYASIVVQYGVVARLAGIVQQGASFDLKVEAGACLCRILLSNQITLDAASASQASVMLFDLLGSTDNTLLISAIYAVHRLFASALASQVLVANYAEVADKVDLLTIHPYSDISKAATDFERLLENYIAAVEQS